MVSSSIFGTNTNSSLQDKGSNYNSKVESVNSDFSKVMKQTLSTSASDFTHLSKNNAGKNTSISDSYSPKLTQNNNYESTKKLVDNKNDSDNYRNEKITYNQPSQKTNNSSMKSNSEKSSELTDKAKDLIKEIKDEIKEKLQISDDQLLQVMQSLNLKMVDLLQVDNIKDIVLQATGTQDILGLLTNENVSSILKEIMDFTNNKINDFLSEMDGDMVDMDLEQILSTIKDMDINQAKNNQEKTTSGIDINELNSLAEDVNGDDVKNLDTQKDNKNIQTQNTATNSFENKITVSTGDSGDSKMMSQNNSAGKEQIVNQIGMDLTNSIQNVFDDLIVQEIDQVDAANVVKQIIDAAKVTVTKSMASMDIQLNPENLGKVNLTVVVKEGMVTAQLTAENEAVKKAIENQLSTLKDNFANQGLKVESIEVTVQSHGYNGNQNLNKGDSNNDSNSKKPNKSLRLGSLDDLSEEQLTEDEKRIMKLLSDDNSSVEYSA